MAHRCNVGFKPVIIARRDLDWCAQKIAEHLAGKKHRCFSLGVDEAVPEQHGLFEHIEEQLLGVVGHVDDREIAIFGEIAQRVEQMLAGENIQPGARFIQKQDLRLGDQRACDQHIFALALAHHVERLVDLVGNVQLREQRLRLLHIGQRNGAPVAAERTGEPREHDIERRFFREFLIEKRSADPADPPPQIENILRCVRFAEHLQRASCRLFGSLLIVCSPH